MKATLKYFYSLSGQPNALRFKNFKTDLFANGETPAIVVDKAVPVGVTVSGATVTGVSITGTAPTGISITAVGTLGIGIGSNGTPITHTVQTSKLAAWYVTCSATSAGVNYEPVLINTIMTGAGQVGGRVRINMQTAVQLGGWANALKASVDLTTAGGASGLLSAFCAEVTAAARAQLGTQCVLEVELVTVSSATFTGACSLLYSNISGNGSANNSFLRNGAIWRFDGLGAADTDEDIFHTTDIDDPTHALRISIGGVMYDLLMSVSTYGAQ